MNVLAFDTGTEMMSIAVARTVDRHVQQWQHTSAGGAQASTHLIATILDLMGQAGLRLDALDAICFGCGPGSFTGLRTACSVAQGLAFGVNVPVLPVDSLLAVAEDARFSSLGDKSSGQITALLDARMDEMYAATYAFDGGQWTELQASRLVRPEELSPIDPAQSETDAPWVMAGNVFAVYGERVAANAPGAASALRLPALPTATAMLRLAPRLLAAGKAVSAEHALPSYIRDKVAKTTQERATEKAAAQAAQAAFVTLNPCAIKN
jgi:tRNA threonylcarbamoyladenosine biosynthesis protein TsaB